ncbi:MAG: hypothetical protein VB858_14420, partial [Planctomycetaceae bacterium]
MRPLQISVATVCLMTVAVTAFGQTPDSTGVTRGFDFLIPAVATGEERQAQQNLWVMTMRFKNVRMMELDVTSPRTGKTGKELIFYLVYEAVNWEIERNAEDAETTPANEYDAPPGPELFVPEMTLVIEDKVTELNSRPFRRELRDEVIPEAQRRIQFREKTRLLNSVQAVGPVPPTVKRGTPDPARYHGIALFRNVDPEMDYFRLVLSGFSNGYKLVKGPVAYDDLKGLAQSGDLRVNDQVWNSDLDADWRAAAEVGDLFSPRKSAPVNADESEWYYSVSPERGDKTSRVWRKTLVV